MFLTITHTLQKIAARVEFVYVSIHKTTIWYPQTDYEQWILNLDQTVYMTLLH